MASNFKISVHRYRSNLQLKLTGDFDGSSAFELLNTLKKNSDGACQVNIQTAHLRNIDPFGRETFRRNLSELSRHGIHILFTGKKAEQIAPDNGLSH